MAREPDGHLCGEQDSSTVDMLRALIAQRKGSFLCQIKPRGSISIPSSVPAI